MIKKIINKIKKLPADEKDKKLVKNLIQVGNEHINELKKIDQEIFAIQKSTKTTFSFFVPVHNYYRTKYQWYYNWHIKPYASKVHMGILTLVLFLSLVAGTVSLLGSPHIVRAADYTCTFIGLVSDDWDDVDSWSGCDGEYPGQNPAKSYEIIVAEGRTLNLNVNNLDLTAGGTAGGNITVNGTLNTNDNTITLLSMTINAGGTVSAGASTLNVKGSWDNINGTFTPNDSTVSFTGTGTINVGATAYAAGKPFNNITVAPSGGITTLDGGGVYATTATIGAGTINSASGTKDLSLTGNNNSLTNSDSGIINNVRITFNPSGNCNIPTANNYYQIFIANRGSAGTNPTAYLLGDVAAASYVFISGSANSQATLDLNGHDFTSGIIYVGQWWSEPATGLGKIMNSSESVKNLNITGYLMFRNGSSTYFDPDNTVDGTNLNINFTGSSGQVWDNNDDANSFQASNSTVTVARTSVDVPFYLGAGTTFNNLVVNHTGSSGNDDVSFAEANLNVDGKLTITDGNLDLATNNPNATIAGGLEFTHATNGSLTRGSGTLTFDGTGTWTDAGTTKRNLGTIAIDGSAARITLGSSVKAQIITVGADDFINLGTQGNTLEIRGDGTGASAPFITRSAGFEKGTNSTVKYTGGDVVSDIDIATVPYHNLNINPEDNYMSPYFYLTGDLTGDNAISGNVILENGGALDPTPSSYDLSVAGDFSSVNGYFNSQESTLILAGNSQIDTDAGVYNLVIDGSASITNSDLSIYGDLTVNGTFNTNDRGLFVQSDITIANGGTWTKGSETYWVTFSGSYDHHFTDNSTPKQDIGEIGTDNSNDVRIIFDSDAKLTAISAVTWGETGCQIDMSNRTITVTGTSANFPGYAIANYDGNTESGNGIEMVTTGSTLVLATSGSYNVNLGETYTYNNLQIENGAVSTDNAINLTGWLNIASGTYNSNSKSLTVGDALTIASGASFTKGGTLTFTGAGNISDLNETKKDLGAVVIEVGSVMQLDSNIKMTTLTNNDEFGLNGNTLEITGTGTGGNAPLKNYSGFSAGTGTVNYTGSGATTDVAAIPYFNLSFTPTSTTTYNLTGSLTGANAMTGSLTINANATLDVRPSSTDYSITATDFIITGVLDATSASSTFISSGGFNYSSGVFTSGSSSLVMTGTGSFNAGANYNTNRVYNFTVNSSGTITLASGISLAAGGVMTLTSGTFNSGGNAIYVRLSNSDTNTFVNNGITYGTGANEPTITLISLSQSAGTWGLIPPASAVNPYPKLHAVAGYTTNATGYVKLGGNINCSALSINGFATGATAIFDTDSAQNYSITINGDLTIGTTVNAELIANGSTINIGGNWINNRTFTAGSSTVNFTKSSDTQTLTSGSSSFNNINHSGAGTLQLSTNAIDINGNFENSAGIFDANNLNVNVAKNWAISGGSFTAKSGGGATTQTVTFDTTNNSIISGSTSFNNLTMDASVDGAKTISFTAGTTQTVASGKTWTINGDSGKVLTLQSTSQGSAWYFSLSDNMNAGNYLSVEDSYSANSYKITRGTNSVNVNNNDGWIFNLPSDAPNQLGPEQYVDGDWVGDNTPTLTFVLGDPDPEDQVKYEIIISTHSDFSSPAVDYTSSLGDQGARSYTPGESLADGSYYWKVKAIDAQNHSSGWTEAGTVGVIDIKIDETGPVSFASELSTIDWTKDNLSLTFSTTDASSGMDHYEVKIDSGEYATQVSPYTIVASDYIDGSHTATVKAIDNLGNFTVADAVTFKIDRTNPSLFVGVLSTEDWTNDNIEATFSTTDASSGIDHYEVKLDAGSYSTQTSPYTIVAQNFADGEHTITVKAIDNVGNLYECDPVAFKIDRTVPDSFVPEVSTADWTNSNLSLTFSTTDETAGMDHYEVKIDTNAYTAQTSPYSILVAGLSDGDHTAKVKAIDAAGNYVESNEVSFKTDKTDPTISEAGVSSGNWTKDNITFTFSASDPASGVDHYEVKIDSGAYATQTSPYTIVASGIDDGEHAIYVKAIDNAGNTKESNAVAFKIDKTNPASFAAAVSTTDWTNDNLNLTFSTTDSMSGIDHYEVKFDSGEYATHTSPFTLAIAGFSDGSHTAKVKAIDEAGNYVETANVIFKTDKTDPVISQAELSTSDWTSSNLTLTFAGSDVTSDVDHFELKIDSGEYSTETSPYTIDVADLADGLHSSLVKLFDNAGNYIVSDELTFRVDKTAPDKGQLLPSVTTPTNQLAVTFNWNEPTDINGVSGYKISIGSTPGGNDIEKDKTTTEKSWIETFASTGTYYFRVKVSDGAGNWSDYCNEISVQIDKSAPLLSISGLSANQYINTKSYTIAGTGSDVGAGIDKVEISFDDGSWKSVTTTNGYTSWTYNWTDCIEGLHTIKVRALGKAGNTTSSSTYSVIVDTVSPTLPADFRLFNISNTPATVFATYLDFAGSSDETSGVKGYELYKGSTKLADIAIAKDATNSNYTGNTNQPYYYIDSGLSSGKYSYKIKTIDNAGNSSETEILEIDTAGKAVETDSITEATGNVSSVVTKTKTSAIVTWKTVYPANSLVEYGTSSSYGTKTELDKNMNQGHSVLLTDLKPQTTYHAKVKSRDVYGRDMESQDFTFTTKPAPEDKSAIKVMIDTLQSLFRSLSAGAVNTAVTADELKNLQGFSNNLLVTDVSFKEKLYYANILTFEKGKKIERSTDDKTYLALVPTSDNYYLDKDLKADTNYYYREDAGNAISRKPIVGDDSPIVINDAKVIKESVQTSKDKAQLTISWTTNRGATSQVEFGPTTSYGQKTKEDSSLNMGHNVVLENLNPDTTYHFKATSKDAKGSVVSSVDFTYQTPSAQKDKTPLDIIFDSLKKVLDVVRNAFS